MWRGLEHLGVGMGLGDLDTTVLAADPALAAIVGHDVAGLMGVSMQSLTHPDDRACNDRMLALLHATRQPVRVTKRYVVGDRPVWVENHVSWLGGEGDEARLLLLTRPLSIAEAPRVPLSPVQAHETALAAGYISEMASQLAGMADRSNLPTTAVALRLAGMIMGEEHEALDSTEH